MIEKINAELEKLNNEKVAINNPAEMEKVINEKVAEYRQNLINEYNADKDTKVKELDFKIACLENWKAEIEEQEKADVQEQVESADATEVDAANI